MNKLLQTVLIIIAGETIFMLPFLIPRLYRPLIIDSWGLSNTDIGIAFSAYGISAMLSYLFGGVTADKYSPRNLISISLFITGLIGVPLILFPSAALFKVTYFFWGISTIFFMWGALIKVTHIFGGEEKRATSMGVLDAGRGLVAAATSSILIYTTYQISVSHPLFLERYDSLEIIYFIVCFFTLSLSILFWLGLKNLNVNSSQGSDWNFDSSKKALKDTKVWLLGIIILSAYCGYKSIDLYSIYLVDIHRFTLEESAALTSTIFWIRPIAALVAGLIADYIHSRVKHGRSFILITLLFASSFFQLILAAQLFSSYFLIVGTILFSATIVYALRAIYFSIFGDLKTPDYLLGTTVGIVSFIGFLPDMFYGLITGHLIDEYPKQIGYEYSFAFTAIVMLIGGFASIVLHRKLKLK